MSSPLAETAQALHDQIRQGNRIQAQRELRKLSHRKIPRADALAIAAVARRADLPGLAIKILNPIVRPSRQSPATASEKEKAEYAACLAYIGAVEEALTILRSLPSERTPDVLIYETFALVSRWEYAATIPLLEKYIASPYIDEYQRLVGKVNLAAALNFERRHEETSRVLAEIIAEASAKNLSLLKGNAFELSAQNALFQARWTEAVGFLRKAEEALRNTGGFDEFFVEKWKAILELTRTPCETSLVRLHQVRETAKDRGHWETLRDCDRFEALATKNEHMLLHVYFGTPYPSFQGRVLADFGRPVQVPERYEWEMAPGNRRAVLDVASGELSGRATRLKVGQVVHRLLLTLTSDFYRPFRLATLYARLYPDEFFNPNTSPTRVHQAVKLLKHWFRSARVPLQVHQKAGLYWLEASAPCLVAIGREKSLGDRFQFELRRLREKWPEGAFSAREAQRRLALSPMSILRLLKRAQAEGVIRRQGSGARTRYVFT